MKMEQNEKKTASTLAFHHPDFEFDDIAENIFLPIYEVIATDLLEETGVVSGQMLDQCGADAIYRRPLSADCQPRLHAVLERPGEGGFRDLPGSGSRRERLYRRQSGKAGSAGSDYEEDEALRTGLYGRPSGAFQGSA